MAISTLAALNAATVLRRPFAKVGNGTSSFGGLMSKWTLAGRPGGAPATARTLNDTTPGALFPIPAPLGGNQMFLAGGSLLCPIQTQSLGIGGAGFMLIDRLVDTSGLSGNLNTEQTTNLPTPALPARAGNGTGVWAALEAFVPGSWFSADPGTIALKYTNEAGVTGRIGEFGDRIWNGNREQGLFIPAWLADGDMGVSAIESITLGAAAGTGGTLGVVLWRPIAIIGPPEMTYTRGQWHAFWDLGDIPQLTGDECLSILQIPANNPTSFAQNHNATPQSGFLHFAEG